MVKEIGLLEPAPEHIPLHLFASAGDTFVVRAEVLPTIPALRPWRILQLRTDHEHHGAMCLQQRGGGALEVHACVRREPWSRPGGLALLEGTLAVARAAGATRIFARVPASGLRTRELCEQTGARLTPTDDDHLDVEWPLVPAG